MKKVIKLIAVYILLILTIACTPALKIGADDNGKTIEINSGKNIHLTLEGNPTTGYQWQIIDNNDSVLKLMGEPEYKSDSNLVGSSGVYNFTFSSQQPGQTKLKLGYLRSWETGKEPLEFFEVLIVVK